MNAALERIEVIEHYDDKLWRLSNLYWIQDKRSRRVKFVPNESQMRFFKNRHGRDVILKARQHGFTTFIDVDGLDDVIFNRNYRFGIIAHSLDDAKVIFRTKIKFPYDNLPEGLRTALVEESDRVDEILFADPHNSSVRVSTSYRSGTLQKLHVSEYGKIALHFPDKADEIKTGAVEAVPIDGQVTFESTAEGAEGEFYTLCMDAMRRAEQGREPNPLQYKFHFEPWWVSPEYELPPESTIIIEEYESYFRDLEREHGIKLTRGQKAWYATKAESLRDKMLREYPSTPEEAFRASVEGAYYQREMSALRRLKRITKVPYDPALPVNTMWDLGYDDSMSIWFHQAHGAQNRLIDYFEDQHEGLPYYAQILKKKPYVYGRHYFPHDIKHHELNDGRSRIEVAQELGFSPAIAVERAKNQDELLDDINWTRIFLMTCWIDEEHCDLGIKCLDNYRKEKDEKKGGFKERPFKNWAAHGADALRTGAVGYRQYDEFQLEDLEPPPEGDF